MKAPRKKKLLLSDFAKKVKEIAENNGQKYYAIQVEFSDHMHSNTQEMFFRCYVEDYDWYKGFTMEEALDKLNKAVNPVKQEIREVEIFKIDENYEQSF
jgi:translation elongation factor EF-1alpha